MLTVQNIPVLCMGEGESELAHLIPKLDELNFTVSGRLCSFTEALRALEDGPSGPIVTIIDLGSSPDEAFALAQEIKRSFPHVRLVITARGSDSNILLRALRAGADEFLPQPFDMEEVREALFRVFKKVEIKPAQQKTGQVVAVFSNKGGAGTTTIAANFAVSLAQRTAGQKSICLVDLDLQFGSVNSVLNVEAAYTIVDVIKNLEQIDPLFLDGAMGKHASGLRILAAPNYAEEASRIEASDVERLLELLTHEFDLVILDCAKRIDEVSLTALQKAHEILFVMPMDVPAINLARKALDLFERSRLPLEKCHLVVNRYFKSKDLPLEAVEKALNTKVFHVVPHDHMVTTEALNQGVSLVEANPKSKVASSMLALAEEVSRLVRVSGHEQEKERQGWLGRLLPMFG